MKRDVLTVFLASPGDLNPERRIAYNVVERANKVLSRRVGWHIELLGWEDTLPGYARPQDIINRDVDCCDLFLGIIWRRWGQSTGKYSSGFHEEFVRARERREKSARPEIWVFFKSVDKDAQDDPGEQLQKVLQFKQEQIERKELLFKEFTSDHDWGDMLYDGLLEYVLDIAHGPTETGPQEAVIEVAHDGRSQQVLETQEPSAGPDYPAELGLILEKANRHITGDSKADLGFWDRTRLFLLGSAWFSQSHLEEDVGVHEINLVYEMRKSWTLSSPEFLLVLRTIVADDYNTRPGWYWFRTWDDVRLDAVMCAFAVGGRDAKLRRMAFSMMARTGYCPSAEAVQKGLGDSEREVVLEVIKLLQRNGLPEHIPLLDTAVESTESKLRDLAITARLDLLYRENANDAFREFVERGPQLPLCLKTALETLDLAVDDELLRRALDSPQTEARRFAASYLRSTRRLDQQRARALLEDADVEVRRQALWALLESGEKITAHEVKRLFPPKQATGRFTLLGGSWDYQASRIFDEFFPAILKQTPPEEILSSLDRYSPKYDVSYRFLAVNHFQLIEPRIRSDLDNEFETVTTELKESKWDPDTIEFVKAELIGAALAGLAEHGNECDVAFARRFFGNTRHNMADPDAVRLLAKYGDESDVQRFLQATSSADSETRRIAFDAALRLSAEKEPILETMLKEGDKETAGQAANELWKLSQERVRQVAKDLLRTDNTDKRLRGLAVLLKFCAPTEMEALLDEYMENPPYYYNVVTWLDRLLYAPGRYGESFKTEMQSHGTAY